MQSPGNLRAFLFLEVKSMKINRASPKQKKAYEGIYPLYGTAHINGLIVHIEELNECQGPKYEIVLPDGYIDGPQHLHFLLCFDKDDLLERLKALDPVPCRCCKEIRHAG